ncbi:GGDEF domain-containing protein [Candidatus Nomurabacteria bacterium]|nr:GGDEF domain-containing protein [Candidatus Nomurabacteria bacterium]
MSDEALMIFWLFLIIVLLMFMLWHTNGVATRKNAALRQSLNEAVSQKQELIEVINKQDDEIAVLKEQANTDALTGLLNRRAFSRAFERMINLLRFDSTTSERRREGVFYALTVLLIDLDKFKSINDSHGHSVGDEVLQAVAQAIQAGQRDSDLVCRWGGEEIILALPNTSREESQAVAEKIRREISALTFSVTELMVTASIGIACTEYRLDGGVLIERADEALYRAKAQGRNRVEMAV